MQHTPGPWKKSHYTHKTGSNLKGRSLEMAIEEEKQVVRGPGIVGEQNCNKVAYVYNPDDVPLIAAAPDLKNFVQKFIDDYNHDDLNVTETYELALELIKKATT